MRIMSEPTIDDLALRYPEVDAFRERMLRELWANRGKGDQASWRTMSLRTAWQEISWHAAKLAAAIKAEDVDAIHELSADVANGAMMLDDIVAAMEAGWDADRTLAELTERQAQPNGLEGVL